MRHFVHVLLARRKELDLIEFTACFLIEFGSCEDWGYQMIDLAERHITKWNDPLDLDSSLEGALPKQAPVLSVLLSHLTRNDLAYTGKILLSLHCDE